MNPQYQPIIQVIFILLVSCSCVNTNIAQHTISASYGYSFVDMHEREHSSISRFLDLDVKNRPFGGTYLRSDYREISYNYRVNSRFAFGLAYSHINLSDIYYNADYIPDVLIVGTHNPRMQSYINGSYRGVQDNYFVFGRYYPFAYKYNNLSLIEITNSLFFEIGLGRQVLSRQEIYDPTFLYLFKEGMSTEFESLNLESKQSTFVRFSLGGQIPIINRLSLTFMGSLHIFNTPGERPNYLIVPAVRNFISTVHLGLAFDIVKAKWQKEEALN